MHIQWTTAANPRLYSAAPDSIVEERKLDERQFHLQIDTHGAGLESLTIIPELEQNTFQLLSCQVRFVDQMSDTALLRIGSGGEDYGRLVFDHLRHFQVNGFTYFLAERDNAAIRINIPAHKNPHNREYLLELRLLVLDKMYVASFRQHFVGQLKKIEQQNLSLQSEVEQLRNAASDQLDLERELLVIKSSRAWRMAESWRRFFYQGLLGRFPSLREKCLNWSRGDIRKKLSDETSTKKLGALQTNQLSHNPRDEIYQQLIAHTNQSRPDFVELAARISASRNKPSISVIMPVFNTPGDWLKQAVDSVLAQRYENFELCICDDASDRIETVKYLKSLDDPRIRLVRLEENGNISRASNRALEMASGDYIAFMDHDDLLDQDALFYIAEAIDQYTADIIYTDEDYIAEDGRYHSPNFKPDYSPDLLLSHNYITHLLAVKKDLLDEVGNFNSDYDGAQDYDLVLRLTERAESVLHIPRVLYHWRQSAESSSLSVTAKPYIQERTRKLLAETMQRRGQDADVLNANLPHFYYVRRRISGEPPVSIVVPFRDESVLLEKCLNSILTKTRYSEYEIIGVNNQSESPLTYELMDAYDRNPRIHFIDYDEPFNFSEIVNLGELSARGEYLVLLNNDIEIISWDWIDEMLCQAQQPLTGVVGGKLFYPNNTIQHAGIVVGIDGYAGHGHKRIECNAQGYGNRLHLVQNVSAVTGAFMMVRRSIFTEVGGFDAKRFPVSCNDVDFCIRVLEAGYWNIFTPHARAYHLESVSRGYELTEENRKRFEKEKSQFRELHSSFLEQGDPFYNRNLSLDNESFMISPAPTQATPAEQQI